MGEIAATMAHQVRSPATAIRLDVERAHDKLPKDAPERALLARAPSQLDQMERAVSASVKVARAARTGARAGDRAPDRRGARGTLAIESAVGLGTTVEIQLPQRGRQAQDA